MASVNDNSDEWQCPRCTLLNKLNDTQCELCGELRTIKPEQHCPTHTINKDNYGSIIYRIEPFTANEMDEIHTIYISNPSKKYGKYPIILYPNNDINYKRDKSSDIALLSSSKYNKEYIGMISKYDRKFCYGVVVQFHDKLLNYYKKIEILCLFNQFKQIIDEQFDYLHRNYIQNGHDIIIPSPDRTEIINNIDRYCMDKTSEQQTIFHNLGTYNNGLPISYYTYIQQKIDQLNVKEIIYPKSVIINISNIKDTEDIKDEKSMDYNDDDDDDNNNNDEDKEDDGYNDLYDDDDEEEEKEIDLNDIKYCKNDPIEVFNKNKNVWIRGIFIAEYMNDENEMEYFVEIPDVLESKIIGIDRKYVRYLQEIEQFMDDQKDNDNDEKAEELILETDEKKYNGEIQKQNKNGDNNNYWDKVNDFVLKEYIIDVIDAVPDVLSNIDLFMTKMEILGINSDKARSRALGIIEEIKNKQQCIDKNKDKKQSFMMKSIITNKAIYVHVMEKGYYLNTFICKYCDNKQLKGGIELTICKHPICYKCFPKYITKCINRKKTPKCKKCEKIFDIKDIEMHIIDDNIKENMIKIINKKQKKYDISDDEEESEEDTESDTDNDSDTNSEDDSDSDDDESSDNDDTESSLDYDDKISQKLKLNGNNKDLMDKDIEKKKKIKKKRNNRKKGLFYCSSSKCDGSIHIKSKRKRMNKTSFKCRQCKAKNCIDCQVIHKQIKDKKIRKLQCQEYQFLYNNKFLNRWKKLNVKSLLNPSKELKKHSKMMKAYKVKRGSIEWNEVISSIQTMNQFNIIRIERIQNSRLYREYYKHCKQMILKRKMNINEMNVWHGTRQTDPSLIWKGNGFDVRYSNVGGCIWFAVQNSYSMGGYQFVKNNIECQVFLAFVASGDYESVKLIRNGQILNVYKNQTMYPGYLVTYQNTSNMYQPF